MAGMISNTLRFGAELMEDMWEIVYSTTTNLEW